MTSRPRVAIAAPAICPKMRGDGATALSALEAMTHSNDDFEIVLFSGVSDSQLAGLGIDPAMIRHEPIASLIDRPQFDADEVLHRQRLFWMQRQLPKQCEKLQVDICHCFGYYSMFAEACRLCPSTRVAMSLLDLLVETFPDQFASSHVRFIHEVVPRSIAAAHAITAISHATATLAMKHYGIEQDKISVVYPSIAEAPCRHNAPSPLPRLRRLGIDGPYFLCVGVVQPHKNVRRVVDAFARVYPSLPDRQTKLVLVGASPNWGLDLMPILAASDHIVHIDHLDYRGEDLETLYGNATALLFVSLGEGFGFPLLEAMRHGTPIITSDCSSMAEVAGPAALLVDPYDVEAIAVAIRTLVTSDCRRKELIAAGYRCLKAFSYRRQAQALATVYQKLLRS